MQTLSYPIAIYSEKNKLIINTLFFFRKVINFYVRQFFDASSLSLLSENKYAYKCLEKRAENKRYYIPSRINRGLLEIAGRILRTIEDRRDLYFLLFSLSLDPKDWDYKLLKEKDIYKKSQYVENIKEQAINYLENNEEGVCPADRSPLATRPLPDDYLDLSNVPKLKNGRKAFCCSAQNSTALMISFAPDDGQAIKQSLDAVISPACAIHADSHGESFRAARKACTARSASMECAAVGNAKWSTQAPLRGTKQSNLPGFTVCLQSTSTTAQIPK